MGFGVMSTTISIVTCTFNSVKFLKEMLESVVGQSHPPLEHVFVDAHSTDETLGIIQEYAVAVPWHVRIVHAPAKGISNAMNIGSREAVGDFILFLHSDDKLHSFGSLASVSNELGESKVWIVGNCQYIDVDGKSIRGAPALAEDKHNIFRSNFISHPSALIRTKTLLEIGGFDERLKIAMDYDLWLRCIKLYTPTLIDDVVSDFRVHADGMSSSNKTLMTKENFVVRFRNADSFIMFVETVGLFVVEALYLRWPQLHKWVSKLKRSN
jgi:glycosyltransferase involved in cell wall biosynthesis